MQVESAAVCKPPRTWNNRGVVTGRLALVHASGAEQPIHFCNIDFSVQELEALASIISSHVQRCRSSGDGGAGAAVAVENETAVSALTDIFRAPGFVDASADDADKQPALASVDAPLAEQQADLLARLSAWDSDGSALLRAAPRIVSARLTVAADVTEQTLSVHIKPGSAVATIKIVAWLVAFVLVIVLIEGLFFWDLDAISEETDVRFERRRAELGTALVAFLVAMLAAVLIGLAAMAVLAAPQDVHLQADATSWTLHRHLQGFARFTLVPRLSSTLRGHTLAGCGCRVRPPLCRALYAALEPVCSVDVCVSGGVRCRKSMAFCRARSFAGEEEGGDGVCRSAAWSAAAARSRRGSSGASQAACTR